jgi:hypothetical protein
MEAYSTGSIALDDAVVELYRRCIQQLYVVPELLEFACSLLFEMIPKYYRDPACEMTEEQLHGYLIDAWENLRRLLPRGPEVAEGWRLYPIKYVELDSNRLTEFSQVCFELDGLYIHATDGGVQHVPQTKDAPRFCRSHLVAHCATDGYTSFVVVASTADEVFCIDTSRNSLFPFRRDEPSLALTEANAAITVRPTFTEWDSMRRLFSRT